MLSKIMKEIKKSDRMLGLNELSQRLGVERSALEGMLDLLVRQGKLREVGPGTEACAHCASHTSCTSLQMGNLIGKAYELVE